MLLVTFSQYVSDLLENEKKFILYAHHQEMLDALSHTINSKVEQLPFVFNTLF